MTTYVMDHTRWWVEKQRAPRFGKSIFRAIEENKRNKEAEIKQLEAIYGHN